MSTTTYWVLRDPTSGKLKCANGGKASTPMLYRTEGYAGAAASLGESRWARAGINWMPVEATLTLTGKTFVERLHQEYDQLLNRLIKLRAFLTSDAYLHLPFVEQIDLAEQEHLMARLANVQNRRLTRARAA
jgi:hypothetical protein